MTSDQASTVSCLLAKKSENLFPISEIFAMMVVDKDNMAHNRCMWF